VDNVCPCTEAGIRSAIQAGGADPYTFDCGGPETVVTTEGIVIDNDVILDGESNLTVDGSESYIVFSVGVVTAELRGLTVTGGGWDSGGKLGNGGEPIPASIGNSGTLTITNSTVSAENEIATIANGATLTITNSTVSWTDGGGINSGNEGSTLTITNSTLSGGQGDGIDEAILIYGTLTVTNSTVVGNIYGEGTVTNSLVDGECAGAMASNGYNIESPGDTCGFDQTGDLVNIAEVQLDLGELANNGGPTMTHALGADSVAIDHIPAVDCGVTTDQRGQPRPETGGGMCDVGAFEVQPPPAESCTQSGGTVSTGLCCQAVESFPNTCTIGACGCGPDASHEVAVCICPTNTCFDGERCVAP